jgi:hypothetical protein
MKKMLLALLIIVSMLIVGCGSKAPICGDGVCSIDEDALNNCPEDCNKDPDIVVSKMSLEAPPVAYEENTLQIVVNNKGFAPAEISGELELYLNGQKNNRRIIDFKDYEFDNIVNVGETIVFKERVWLWEPGIYKLKFNTNVLNKEDLSARDNYQEIEFEVSKQSYPEYLIEEKMGSMEYRYSRTDANSYYAFDFANNNKGKTYIANYDGFNADESGVYMNGEVAVTVYERDIDAAEFAKKIAERTSNGGGYAYLNKWNNYLVYSISSNDYRTFEIYWISGNKLIHLYSYGDWTDSRYRFINGYTDKHPSTIPLTINCGNGQCDSNQWSIDINSDYKSVVTQEGYQATFKGANEYTDTTGAKLYKLTFNIKDVEQGLTPYKHSVAMIDDRYIHFQVLDYYEYESCEYNTESASVNFTGIGTKQANDGSAVDVNCGMKFNEECDMGNGITIRAYGAYEKEVYFASSPDNGWTNMKVGETRLIGNTKIKLDAVSGIEKTNCVKRGFADTNVGENYRTCPNDCSGYYEDKP